MTVLIKTVKASLKTTVILQAPLSLDLLIATSKNTCLPEPQTVFRFETSFSWFKFDELYDLTGRREEIQLMMSKLLNFICISTINREVASTKELQQWGVLAPVRS